MTRLDLAFILCCCRACLGGSRSDEENYYDLLGIDRDASLDDIKRAYKRKSLDLHPDKLAQKGLAVTAEDQARFTKMKEAYEILSDPHKRETYDAIGEKGMKWIEEPFSIDPQEMANNFANSSTLDRSKIFAIFLFIAIAVFILPVLVCIQIDGGFGYNTSWAVVATPLWIWNVFIMFYHVRIIMMGPIPRPEHIPEEDWFDPLPMSKRYIGLCRFLLYLTFQVLAVMNLDGVINFKWSLVFIPIILVEFVTLIKRFLQAKTEIVTVQEIETIFGKPFTEFTEVDKVIMKNSYKVFASQASEAYLIAKAIQESAKTDLIRIGFRFVFVVLLMLQLDTSVHWSWWLVFTPFFAMSCCICCSQCQKYAEVQAYAAEKLQTPINETEGGTDYGAMEEGGNTNTTTTQTPLTEQERDEIKSEIFKESSKAMTTCCSQTIFILLLCVCLSKIQGAGFSSLWILSPFLFLASIILCVLGCTIFCVSPIDEEEMNTAYQRMEHNLFATGTSSSDPEQTNNVVVTQVDDTTDMPINNDTYINHLQSTKEVESQTNSISSPVDLLDDRKNTSDEYENNPIQTSIEPTRSEVDDLD